MKKSFGFLMFATAFALTSTSTSALAADFSGRWATKTSGEMRLDQSGNHVTGTYALNGGQIRGEVSGDRLSGIWAQSNSGRRCASTQQGTNYWGRLSVRLSGDAGRWSGRWSYCDEAEGSGGEWNGDRIGPSFSGRWATKTSGEMRLVQSGDHVDGSYALNGGQIRGALKGDQLSGLWAQSTSGRRCNRQQLGTAYWGSFSYKLSGDGKRWSGPWAYCDEPAGSGGVWEAERIGE
jgi:hypothetical protein